MSGEESGDHWSDSEFEDSGFQSSRGVGSEAKNATPSSNQKPGNTYRNLPFDEALDLSQSQESFQSGRDNKVANQKFDEEFDVSASLDHTKGEPTPGRGNNATMNQSQKRTENQHHDEEIDLSDDSNDDASIETNPDEKGPKSAAAAQAKGGASPGGYNYGGQAAAPAAAAAQAKAAAPEPRQAPAPARGAGAEEDSEEEEESEDDPNDADEQFPKNGYNPNDYKHLNVSNEVKDLFQYITRYKPHEVELDTTLKCFIPEFVPAVGEMDAFIKVPKPDQSRDELGLKVLDEPAAQQSDPTVLELKLRASTKSSFGKDITVRSIENAAKNTPEVDRWIQSIEELHRTKQATEVQYKKNMPDIESLMQEWPPEFEEMLTQVSLPGPQMEMKLEEYARVICAIMDIPVYDNLIESVHLLLSLYLEFKENPHFAGISKAQGPEAAGAEVMGMGGMGGMAGVQEIGGNAEVFTLD